MQQGFWSGSWRSGSRGSLPIRGLQQGGYSAMPNMPNPNSGMSLFNSAPAQGDANRNLLQMQADAADKFEMSKVQANEDMERLQATEDPLNMRFRPFQQTHREQANQMQNAMSDWRLFNQSLKNQGVDNLQTAAAAGVKEGGGYDRRQVVDYTPGGKQVQGYVGMGLGGSKPGFFDHAPGGASLAQLQQRGTGNNGDMFYGMTGRTTYEKNALDALRNWRIR